MRRLLLFGSCLGALSFHACNWISPQCGINADCPPFTYCNPYDRVCFECPPDKSSIVLDGGIVECVFGDGGSSDGGSGGDT